MKIDKSYLTVIMSIIVIALGGLSSFTINEYQTKSNKDIAKQALERAKKADNAIEVAVIKRTLDDQVSRLTRISSRLESLTFYTYRHCR